MICVRAPNWIGDHVMAERLYRSLRTYAGNERLVLFAPKTHEGLWTKLFDETWFFSRAELRTRKGFFSWAQRVRRAKFTAAISLPSSWSAAALFAVARVPMRVGFAEPGAGIFLRHPVRWRGRESGAHKADLYLDLLKPLGVAPAAERVIRATGDPAGPIVLAPGASIELRQWPYFARWVGEHAKKEPTRQFVVVGTHKEKPWAEKIAAAAPGRVEDRTGKTTLPELVALCETASLVLANDSGVAHVAATVAGAPTSVLFGPGDPNYIAPRGPQVTQHYVAGLPCRPCESRRCHGKYGHKACLLQLAIP